MRGEAGHGASGQWAVQDRNKLRKMVGWLVGWMDGWMVS